MRGLHRSFQRIPTSNLHRIPYRQHVYPPLHLQHKTIVLEPPPRHSRPTFEVPNANYVELPNSGNIDIADPAPPFINAPLRPASTPRTDNIVFEPPSTHSRPSIELPHANYVEHPNSGNIVIADPAPSFINAPLLPTNTARTDNTRKSWHHNHDFTIRHYTNNLTLQDQPISPEHNIPWKEQPRVIEPGLGGSTVPLDESKQFAANCFGRDKLDPICPTSFRNAPHAREPPDRSFHYTTKSLTTHQLVFLLASLLHEIACILVTAHTRTIAYITFCVLPPVYVYTQLLTTPASGSLVRGRITP